LKGKEGNRKAKQGEERGNKCQRKQVTQLEYEPGGNRATSSPFQRK
jgi:hypothetical protein